MFGLDLPQLGTRSKGHDDGPVQVSGVTGGRLVHLAGLDLSPASMMAGIA